MSSDKLGDPFFALLRLESHFPRPVGDSANPQSHAFNMRVSVIEDATVDRVVYGASQILLASFVKEAKTQITQGALAVGTSCGFMFEHQAAIQSQIAVPFVSSSLTLLATGLPEPVAVLSFDGEVLEQAPWFKNACKNTKKIGVGGIPKAGYLYTVMQANQTELDLQVATAEVVKSAIDLAQASVERFGIAPQTLLFECTNLGVYKIAVQKALADSHYDCKLIDYNDVMAFCSTGV